MMTSTTTSSSNNAIHTNGTSSSSSNKAIELADDDFDRLEVANSCIVNALRSEEVAGEDFFGRWGRSSGGTSIVGTPTSSTTTGTSIGTTTSTTLLLDAHGYTIPPKEEEEEEEEGLLLSPKQSIPIPPLLLSEISSKAHISTLMGLFPSANLAWLTVDSTCYLWSYSSNSTTTTTAASTDFCSFTVPSNQCITSVGLAPPKVGIFKSQVRWILIISTPEEVLLCAITTTTTEEAQQQQQQQNVFGPNLRIIPTTFCLPTDGCSIYVIQSTSQGRIFLGTSDGNVLEFCYQVDLQKHIEAQLLQQQQEEEEAFEEDNYDDDEDTTSPTSTTTWTSTILSGSKRLLTDFLFSSSSSSSHKATTQQQPRKKQCRKVNHTQPSFFATLLPNFLHSLFFISSINRGGDGSPIVDMVLVEDDAKTTLLHVLNANGILYTYSLLPNTTELQFLLSSPINIPRLTQQYLEALTRPLPQQDYYSYSSSTASTTSTSAIQFAGGIPVALAGLGGTTVECAKRILKYCSTTTTKRQQQQGSSKGILHPIRIYGIPPYISSQVGLIVVTQGGFRLYLSLISKENIDKVISSTHTSKVQVQLRHIRAPPSSYTSSSSKVNPGVLQHHHNQQQQQLASVVASYYDAWNQTLLLGLDGYVGLLGNTNMNDVAAVEDQYMGDTLLACIPDLRRTIIEAAAAATTRDLQQKQQQQQQQPGSKEIVCTPKVTIGFGRIWQITGLVDESFLLSYLTRTNSISGISTTTSTPSFFDVHLPACPSVVMLKHKKKYKVILVPSKRKEGNFYTIPPTTTTATQMPTTPTMSTTPTPLPLLALQFYKFLFGKDDEIFMLTTGGIHVYKVSSTLELLARGLSSPSMSDSKIIQKFLPAYGAAELCCMCLTIAIATSSSQSLIQRAKRIALAYGGRPTLLLEGEEGEEQKMHSTATSTTSTSFLLLTQQPQQPSTFRPSSLHQGFVTLLTRLLHPLWFQPFLQVVAPSTLKKYSSSKLYPRKESKRLKPHRVQILFDPNLILFELKALQKLMKDIFVRAVESIPALLGTAGRRSQRREGASTSTTMDVDEWMFSSPPARPSLGYVTAASRMQQPPSSQLLLPDENRNAVARFYEETSLHNLYRLLSRTTQALTLLGVLLRRQKEEEEEDAVSAENVPVEWGFLHNLTLHQIVCSPEATDRITALLQSMLLSASSSFIPSSSPSDGAYYYHIEGSNFNSRATIRNHQIAQELSSHCYLYFSQSDYMSQEAMAAIIAARGEIPGSETFRTLSHRAATLWTKAASCWRSARLVTGKLVIQHPPVTATGIKEESSFLHNFPQDLDTLAFSSIYSSSPLVKACVALYSISNVSGIVDVCLTCAANFGGTASGTQGETVVGTNYMLFHPQAGKIMDSVRFPWEDGLYRSTTSASSQSDTAISTMAGGGMYSPQAAEGKGLLHSLSPVAARATATLTTANGMGSSSLVYSEGEEVAGPSNARKFCCSLVLHFLNLLLLKQKQQLQEVNITEFPSGIAFERHPPKLAESMLSVCVASNDQYFHNMLYDFLLSSDYVSTLLRLQTPFLEEWLAKIKSAAAAEDGTQLLYRYYIVHQRHDLASAVMERKASVETETIALENRIEFLTRAISSASAAVNDITGGGDRSLEAMKLSELKDKLEVALLQKKILISLGGLDETGLDSEKKQALQYKLLSVSELFNDYAAPMGLYEICLLIINVCKTNDSSTIEDIWKRIISSVLDDVWSEKEDVQEVLHALKDDYIEGSAERETKSDFQSGEWIRPMQEKITSLGKQLWGKGADFTYPLLLIIPIVEGLRQTFLEVSEGGRTQSLVSLESSLHWPVLSFAQAGIPYPTILEYYRMILSEKEKEGDLDGSFHYLRCISEILTQWIKSSYSVRSKVDVFNGIDYKTAEMQSQSDNSAVQLIRARSTGLLNLIDNYKSSLEAMVGKRSREASQLLKIYTDIEENLRAF